MAAGWTTDGRITLLVVDTSVAIKFVTQEKGSEAAYQIVTGPESLIAPDWMLAETASALWKKVKFSLLLERNAERALKALPDFFEKIVPSRPLLDEAFRLSFRLGHPVYDCLFLALGLRENAPVITADRDFCKAAGNATFGDHVMLLEVPA